MSDRDVLDEAFAALRAETVASTADDDARAAATRRQLLLAAAAQQRRRSRALRFVLPLAAALAAGTAWAAVTGRLTELVSPRPATVVVAPSARMETASSPPASAAIAPPLAPEPEPEPEPTAPQPQPQPEAQAKEQAPASSLPSSSGPTPSTSAAPSPAAVAPSARADDRESTLYRAAHEAHFVAHDPPDALVAWDRYLDAYPNGRFAPEARYNRALMLIRVGRTAEARAALRPFADAAPGSYRQAEARALLDATK